jgi:glutaredoxin 2
MELGRFTTMTYLFTKKGCDICDKMQLCMNLEGMEGLKVVTLDSENSEALALLAYYECVALSEKQLPILVSDDREVIADPLNIAQYIQEHWS